MSSFKMRVIFELNEMRAGTRGVVRSTIAECIKIVEGIEDDEHSGEKCAGPNWEAECERLRETLKSRESTIELLEGDLRGAEKQIIRMGSEIARLEGFREGVVMGINTRNGKEKSYE